ncbi:MAG: Phosphoribosylglycinamide formyltransferase [Firmicutes bacterium ADurb.Bin080]|nr:phosphoribosylglycinamide formyltransferase [Clostridiales bacterium]OQC13048.1 MAG: Phosphoribosylglycinamide formyltransferase [Firmicutes bacterium ADurb.Bin080]
MKNIAVFVSGGGTDLQSIIDAVQEGSLKVNISLVIGSKAGIYALERAKSVGIPVHVFCKNDYENLSAMYEDVISLLKLSKIDYIVLAGYLSILSPNIINAFEGRIINVHPALLPKFGGKGYYGMRVHEAVIASGEKISGATVHYVDEGTDTGKIISQGIVPVFPDDTPETLQKRVLELEHKLLPQTLAELLNDK